MNPQNTATKAYSPFWALVLLFTTLIFLQAWYVKDDFNLRSQINAESGQLKDLVGKAQTISQTTEAVGRELVALSSDSEEAKKIITEFKIQLNKPPEPAK